jgi:hypothetical protein
VDQNGGGGLGKPARQVRKKDFGVTGPRGIARSIGAVLAGLAVTIVLSVGTDAVLQSVGLFGYSQQRKFDWPYCLATLYRTLYTVIGGYVTARIAPVGPMRHAMVLGAIGLGAAIGGVIAASGRGPDFGPFWYPLAIAAVALPGVWLGAQIRVRQLSATPS